MTQPQSSPPFTVNPVVEHWACLEIDHRDHPLMSLCGEPMEMTRQPPGPPEHMCSVCQLLAPHHAGNCQGCSVWVRQWSL